MNANPITEPLGRCARTGYPLVSVHDTNGTHAGPAIAEVEDLIEHVRNPHADRSPIRDLANPEEMFRSWAELLMLALHEYRHTDPDAADRHILLTGLSVEQRHHYDPVRVVAAIVHLAAVHASEFPSLTNPGIVITPDVGLINLRSAATSVINRIQGTDEIADSLARIRATYYREHLAA